jgi:DNA-binding transcriptional regulator YiaG
MTTEDRFWAKVDKTDHCWLWTACVVHGGYGQFSVSSYRAISAHRFSYMLHNGSIPSGLMVCHACDNPRCVRPDHLFLGTQADNIRDKVAKNRQATGARHGSKTKPERVSRGERQHSSKLSADQVRAIRSQYPTLTLRALAKEFGVSYATVHDIVTRQIWRHVE